MTYKFTDKKRIRKNFGKRKDVMKVPYLLELQKSSFQKFLQADVDPHEREDIGLQATFNSAFPIVSANSSVELQFDHYRLGTPEFDEAECRQRGLTYTTQIRATLRLVFFDKTETSQRKGPRKAIEIKENDSVYIGDLPLMTETGSFIINGTERVVVSQLHRSPGVFFDHDRGKTHSSGKLLFSCRIIPYWGAWLDFEFDARDHLYMRIDRRKKEPATLLLRALGLSNEQILEKFFQTNTYTVTKRGQLSLHLEDPTRLRGQVLSFDLKDSSGKLLVEKDKRILQGDIRRIKDARIRRLRVPIEYLKKQRCAKNYAEESTGNIVLEVNQEFTENDLETLIESLQKAGINQFETIYTNEIDYGPYIAETLDVDPVMSEQDARDRIYKIMRPGDPPTRQASDDLFKNLFFTEGKYDLSKVGRMKLNRKLRRESNEGPGILSEKDIINVLRMLIDLKDGRGEVDDIDNLGNRRVRTVGELVENQFRMGLTRVERAVREQLSQTDIDTLTPQDLINAKPVSAVVREFFRSSQLSQFMDQTNPLSEVTHKRRVTALGPGGLTRERAGFEVRDVHPTHYGRVCPIETPEGPNIGLINSLAVYTRINNYGFLETPYRRVAGKKVSGEVEYLSAIEEGDYVIAQSSAASSTNGQLSADLIPCRYNNEFTLSTADKIDFVDVAPAQIVSIATALIPFLEHDDANRALMGSNMQRQAVPTIQTETPLIGTGIESVVGVESGATLPAKRGGIVDSVDAGRVVVRVNEEETGRGDLGVDIYDLIKYRRSNQSTTINQRPLVKVGDQLQKGDILADGPATKFGELALGRNVLIAFMSWNGYNFEDSIVISERLVQDEVYTTVHIEELSVEARDTKTGNEEITRDIPNQSEEKLAKLDESGIVYKGAEVKAGDILVGKVSPKQDDQPSPQEKLLQAIFGDKASNIKDTSLKMPSGMSGTVIDVRVFTNTKKNERDARAQENIDAEIERLGKDRNDQYRIEENAAFGRIAKLLVGQIALHGPGELEPGTEITQEYLDGLTRAEWFEIKVKDQEVALNVEELREQIAKRKEAYDEKFEQKCMKVEAGDKLNVGVLKRVKVFVAVKRRLQPGDKIAGRHGNKGVISKIVPIEDMPYTEDGTTVDIILNPLGVPSRMNVGQVLETHLGWASRELGKQIGDLIDSHATAAQMRKFLFKFYTSTEEKNLIRSLNEQELAEFSGNLREGVPISTPVFDGATEQEVKDMLELAGLPTSGQAILYDGCDGEPFERSVTIGYMYMLKLSHLVDDKMHARSTGPYSLITQQPLGGKAMFGGQRFGEMEVWALEAYGAAYTLQEILTVKADDMTGRAKIYENIVDGTHHMEAKTPESFNVLIKEIRSLGLNIEMRRTNK